MHLWQNPHHTDWDTYQKHKSVFDTARWVIRKFLTLERTDNRCAGGSAETSNDALAGHQSRQSETKQYLFRQSYVFHTIPKIIGEKPRPKTGSREGLYLLEKFQPHRFRITVAVILGFTVHGLVFGIHFRYVAGLQGLDLYRSLLWISFWITGLSTVIIFRCSEYWIRRTFS